MKGPSGRGRHTGALHHDTWNWVKINDTHLKGESGMEREGDRKAGLLCKLCTSGNPGGENRNEEGVKHLLSAEAPTKCPALVNSPAAAPAQKPGTPVHVVGVRSQGPL